jgi:hypothetical protein
MAPRGSAYLGRASEWMPDSERRLQMADGKWATLAVASGPDEWLPVGRRSRRSSRRPQAGGALAAEGGR